VNADGTMVTQRDSMPMQNSYPTSLWLPDEYVTDRYLFDSALSNRYNLRIGLYDAETGTRLPLLTQSSGAGSDFFVVTLSAEDRE
jgi:hypothetical protein